MFELSTSPRRFLTLGLLLPFPPIFGPSSISENMETASELPLDILGYVADVLGADSLREQNRHAFNDREANRQAFYALKMLCLTCKSMVPICRRYLFAKIRFLPIMWQGSTFNEFLLSDPTIKHIYTAVRQTIGFSTWDYDLLQKLCYASSLTSIEISSDTRTRTGILLSLVRKSTLRHLILNSIENFPAALDSRNLNSVIPAV